MYVCVCIYVFRFQDEYSSTHTRETHDITRFTSFQTNTPTTTSTNKRNDH